MLCITTVILLSNSDAGTNQQLMQQINRWKREIEFRKASHINNAIFPFFIQLLCKEQQKNYGQLMTPQLK
jgi:hypothetical protein